MKIEEVFENIINLRQDRLQLLSTLEDLFSSTREELKVIQKDLKILEVIKRIIVDKNEFVDDNFGNSEFSSLYIDGQTQYISKEEKELVQDWIKELRDNKKEE